MPPEAGREAVRADHPGPGRVRGALRQVVACLLALIGLPVLLLALVAKPGLRRGLGARLGATPDDLCGAIWLHAASAGEATILAKVGDRLDAAGHRLYASFTSENGRTMLRRRKPGLACGLAPIDHPWAVDRVLARIQPSMLVLIETELWPCLIAGAQRRGIPVVVLAARVSDRSFVHYRLLRHLVGPTLRRLSLVGARSREDAERYISLGAHQERVYVTGDLKRMRPVEGLDVEADLEAFLADVPLLIGGSTHPGEEAAMLEALAACEAAGHRLALVLAPRQCARADEVERVVEKGGRVHHRRTAIDRASEPLAAGEVLILDTLGELSGLFALGSLAFVGGTLAEVGGHNLLEPVQAGVPVCYGPHIANVRDTAAFLEGNHTGYPVADASDLARRAVDLFGDHAVIEAARQTQILLNANTASLDRSLSLLEGLGLVKSA